MAIPTIASQLITLVYNIADTWFIGQTDNPYMVAASALVLTIFLMTTALANLFGTGGGTLMVRLLGAKEEDEAQKVASFSVVMAGGAALLFSLLCLIFMDPLLRFLGASKHTIGYARQYLFFVVCIGGVPAVLSQCMSTMVRNVGHAKEAAFGLSLGGVLNVILDPIFMFLLMPDGYEVMGAAIATMFSNVIALTYFILTYKKLRDKTILALPKRVERIEKSSLKSLLSVGFPAAASVLLFDLTTIFINRLSAAHGDIALAAIGIVLKVERLPLNIGIGICLGMVPLVAYNYAAKDLKRMYAFFSRARLYGVIVAAASVVLYRLFAPYIMQAFIADTETVRLGTVFLEARCFATPFMFLSFHMVHLMQSVNRGRISLYLAVIRQLLLNIPILFLMDHLFGAVGIVWTQAVADILNVAASYLIYFRIKKEIDVLPGGV
ncbi:MAG: cation transporter [Clostridiales bacterium]|nr:cation transporter [Clostridiales bacterium]